MERREGTAIARVPEDREIPPDRFRADWAHPQTFFEGPVDGHHVEVAVGIQVVDADRLRAGPDLEDDGLLEATRSGVHGDEDGARSGIRAHDVEKSISVEVGSREGR